MNQMFGMEFKAQGLATKSNCMPNCQQIMSFIHFNSDNHAGDLCIGMSHMSCKILVDKLICSTKGDIYNTLLRTTVGEISNVLAGEFFISPQVSETYGAVTFCTPVTLDESRQNNPDFPIIEGFSGKITSSNIEIYTFLSNDQPAESTLAI